MPDVKGLMADPEFQSLDEETQRKTLGQIDPEFSSLTPEQFKQFKSGFYTTRKGAVGSFLEGIGNKLSKVRQEYKDILSQGGEMADIDDPTSLTNTMIGLATPLSVANEVVGAVGRSIRHPSTVTREVQDLPGKIQKAQQTEREMQDQMRRGKDWDKFNRNTPSQAAPKPAAQKPPTTSTGRPLTPDEIRINNTAPVFKPEPPPYNPPQAAPAAPRRGPVWTETSTPVGQTPPAPSAEPIKPPLGYVRKAPIDLGDITLPEKPSRAAAARFTPEGHSVPEFTPAKDVTLPSGRRAGSIANQVQSAPESGVILQEDGKPLMKVGTEPPGEGPTPAPKTSRAVRATPEKQAQSDKIADLQRHAKVIPLAEKIHATNDVTSKDLLALTPEQRAVFMKEIGLGKASDKTWETLIGHVQRLEKTRK